MTISHIAEQFLSFYKSKGAEVLSSAPLIHPLFPMSFNMSAGLVQLDPLLRSTKVIKNKKMVVVQKCFRHFDVSRVTDYSHLSYFEMGGYFEVGNFNKVVSMEYIYDLLVNEYQIDPNKLWVTYFSGDTIFGKQFPKDIEMLDCWKQLLPNKDHIIGFDKEYNFWTQGGGAEIAIESKLCGPQTEIFYDLGDKGCRKDQCLPNCECGRFLEISNNLFITHKITGELQVLPLLNKAIESVIGIERVCTVIEKMNSVFDIEEMTHLTHFLQTTPTPPSSVRQVQARKSRIVDHIRGLCFLIPEGAPLPGRNGRARIIRTLMRELLTDLYVLKLNSSEKIQQLIHETVSMYQGRYPDLLGKEKQIFTMISDQEAVYLKTLDKAGRAIRRHLEQSKKEKLDQVEAEYFKKQFGIPIELQERDINP